MAEWIATQASRGHRTICLQVAEETYRQIVADPRAFRYALDACFRQTPELFPANFARGYQLKDHRTSAKQGVPIRRILTRDGIAYSVRPSFLMPYLTAHTEEVQGPLFLRKFGVPFWALARVFGGDPMSWCRRECALGRLSLVGTTVRQAEMPTHLLADEHLNRYFDYGQHLHGSHESCRLHCRAWALLWHFTPWHPATTRKNEGWRCPAERLNQHRYSDCWLQNLLLSGLMGGYRSPHPQNP